MVQKIVLRAAADLAPGAAQQTPAIPCFGARQVVIVYKATNSNGLAACTIEIAGGASGGTWYSPMSGLTVIGTPAGNNLAGGGYCHALSPADLIPWRFCRGNFSPHASLTITGLSITAFVFWDDHVARTLEQPNTD